MTFEVLYSWALSWCCYCAHLPQYHKDVESVLHKPTNAYCHPNTIMNGSVGATHLEKAIHFVVFAIIELEKTMVMNEIQKIKSKQNKEE